MNILISLSYHLPNISGLTIYAQRLSEELVQRGYNVTILTSKHNDNLAIEEVIHGVSIVRVPVSFYLGKGPIMFSLPFYAWRWIRWADVVNCHLPQFESSLMVILAKLFGKKVVLTHHTDLSGWPGIVNKVPEASVFVSQFISATLADKINVYTKDYANHSTFLKFFKPKLVFTYPPVRTGTLDRNLKKALKEKIGNTSFIIGFSGRIARQKGLPYLLNAIPYLSDTLKDFKLALAGPYEGVIGEHTIDSLKPLINTYKNNVVLLGPIAPDKMVAFYSLLDVLVLPSDDRLESFGFVQIEAMLAGCPVVATDLPGARIPILETGMGELVEIKNSKALAEAIKKVITNKKSYIKPQEEIRKTFNFDETIKAYEKLFAN